MREDVRREVARKMLHMAMGAFAFVLHWLSPWQAALCALAALSHNLWLFPYYGYRKLLRPEEKASGYSGMLGYPAVVLALCLLFPTRTPDLDPVRAAAGSPPAHVLWAVAGAWALLAFGDALAGLSGMFLKGPALAWNPNKRWSGFLCFAGPGSLAAALTAYFVAYGDWRFTPSGFAPLLMTCALAGLVGAVVESLPGQIDDNLTVPLAAGLVLVFFQGFPWADFWQSALFPVRGPGDAPPIGIDSGMAALLAFNLVLGLVAWRRRWVTGRSAALGILWGTLVAVGSGWEGYALLLLFYLLANGSTYVGASRKAQLRIDEGDGGRRGAGSVFSKGLFPALFALVSPVALTASLAAYASDTVASEIGKLSRRGTFLISRLRRAEPGTPGAVSALGSLAGLATIALFALFFWAGGALQIRSGGGTITRFFAFFLREDLRRLGVQATGAQHVSAVLAWAALAIFVSAALCFFLESFANELLARRAWMPKEVVHLAIGGLAGSLPFVLSFACHGGLWPPLLWMTR